MWCQGWVHKTRQFNVHHNCLVNSLFLANEYRRGLLIRSRVALLWQIFRNNINVGPAQELHWIFCQKHGSCVVVWWQILAAWHTKASTMRPSLRVAESSGQGHTEAPPMPTPLCLCGPTGDTTGVSIWQAFNQSASSGSHKHWINIAAFHLHSRRRTATVRKQQM